MKKTVEGELEVGDLFRVAGPRGVGPEVWTWDGIYEDPNMHYGYVCRRLHDDFTMTLYPSNKIVKVDPLEDL